MTATPIIQRQLVELDGRFQHHVFRSNLRLRHARAESDRRHQGPELHHRRYPAAPRQEVRGAERAISTDARGGPPSTTRWIVATASTSPTAPTASRSGGHVPAAYPTSAYPGTATRASPSSACRPPTNEKARLGRQDGAASTSAPENIVVFRYADDQGTPPQFAPTEEEFQLTRTTSLDLNAPAMLLGRHLSRPCLRKTMNFPQVP